MKFGPDAPMKKILTGAIAIGNAAAKSDVWYLGNNETLNEVGFCQSSDSS